MVRGDPVAVLFLSFLFSRSFNIQPDHFIVDFRLLLQRVDDGGEAHHFSRSGLQVPIPGVIVSSLYGFTHVFYIFLEPVSENVRDRRVDSLGKAVPCRVVPTRIEVGNLIGIENSVQSRGSVVFTLVSQETFEDSVDFNLLSDKSVRNIGSARGL